MSQKVFILSENRNHGLTSRLRVEHVPFALHHDTDNFAAAVHSHATKGHPTIAIIDQPFLEDGKEETLLGALRKQGVKIMVQDFRSFDSEDARNAEAARLAEHGGGKLQHLQMTPVEQSPDINEYIKSITGRETPTYAAIGF